MGCSRLLILGFVLNVAHCLETLDAGEEAEVETVRSITALLGDEVYLSCIYLGENEISGAHWKRQSNSKKKMMRLAGFNGDRPYSFDPNFSEPASRTNLTCKVNISSVEAEGEYTCVFDSDEYEIIGKTTVTVVAQPDIETLVNEETFNGTQYQSVSCSAANGRPMPQISWLVNGLPPSVYPFTVEMSDTVHPNGTATMRSVLRFPTHLQDEESVTCVVQHPTLPDPQLTTVRVATYVAPNVTIKAELVQQEEGEFWVVSCMASGGRPETDISLVLATGEELQQENDTDSDIQTSSYHLPAQVYEGQNVTCVFDHPKFTHKESRVITLPSFYLSRVQLFHSGTGHRRDEISDIESLELQEGQSDTIINLEAAGNVPRYSVSCNKDGERLPEGVEVVGSSLRVQAPLEFYHGGLYECVLSYHTHSAMIQFNITVKPKDIEPVPPMIRVDLQSGAARRVIECLAADAVPAANMSWLLPEGVSGVSSFNFTSHNGSHSVRGVLLLPACSPWELTVECVINHPAWEKPENRSITLPVCARPNITVSSRVEWRGGERHSVAECRVNSVAPAATITWHVANTDGDNTTSHLQPTGRMSVVQASGLVTAHSTVQFRSSLYSGQKLTCVVEHLSLEEPEKREIYIPVYKAAVLNVSVVRQQDSPLWLAVCEYRGEGVTANLAWILPENTTGQSTQFSEYEGHTVKTRLTYQFPLARHEGQALTCVNRNQQGKTENRTVDVPIYYISFTRAGGHAAPLQSYRHGKHLIHKLALKENLPHQKLLLHVYGNAPVYNITCQRSDGSLVPMEGTAMLFHSKVTKRDEGIYKCHVSFCHHKAAAYFQVEVASYEEQICTLVIICISSASAIFLILLVILWAFWGKCDHGQTKNAESSSALTSLMQDPCSPELKKAPVSGGDKQEYAHLVSYSIVLDVKSTV
ncbi:uncharacterized protein LOC115369615 [Myripristis murdjan]|uniref:uncharacterized protein LOC115369615 n=1 Tax=Myripristis murdjan TaxID=586833 RepID=UPI001175F6ED|nr:uncharacterized protein LOC115369615 [Myripristis murdjan]